MRVFMDVTVTTHAPGEERLLLAGADSLADEELLAILLGRSADDGAARRRAHALIATHGPLRRLASRSLQEIGRTPGMRPSQALRLAATFALTRRLMGERLRPGVLFTHPRQIFDHYHGPLRDRKKEIFLVVLLDARHRIQREEIVSEGSLTSSIVHPREVFAPAVRESAGAVVLVHNHPSGDPSPSEEDVAVTRRLVQASEYLGIRVLDHVIVGDGTYASFKEAGLL